MCIRAPAAFTYRTAMRTGLCRRIIRAVFKRVWKHWNICLGRQNFDPFRGYCALYTTRSAGTCDVERVFYVVTIIRLHARTKRKRFNRCKSVDLQVRSIDDCVRNGIMKSLQMCIRTRIRFFFSIGRM